MTAVWHHGFVGRTYWNTHEGLFMVAIPYENLVLIDVEVNPQHGLQCMADHNRRVGSPLLRPI